MTTRDQAAIDAIRRLRAAQSELEQAGRPDGEIVELTRDRYDAIMDNLGVAARRIVDLAEGVS
jgi:hypothetical protein